MPNKDQFYKKLVGISYKSTIRKDIFKHILAPVCTVKLFMVVIYGFS